MGKKRQEDFIHTDGQVRPQAKIAFIDPSINNIGYSIYNVNSLHLLSFGIVKSDHHCVSESCNDKSFEMAEALHRFVAGVPNVWIEEPPTTLYGGLNLKARAASVFKTFAATYAIATFLKTAGVTVSMFNPNQWQMPKSKRDIKNVKEWSIDYAASICGVEVNEHTADAIVMGHRILPKIKSGHYTVKSSPSHV